MRTLLLDNNWDITLDTNGRMALTTAAYAVAQSVASAVRLFQNDAYYAKDQGLPYFEIALAIIPSESVIRTRLKNTALTVAGVADAVVEITAILDRKFTGVINLTLTDGGKIDVNF